MYEEFRLMDQDEPLPKEGNSGAIVLGVAFTAIGLAVVAVLVAYVLWMAGAI